MPFNQTVIPFVPRVNSLSTSQGFIQVFTLSSLVLHSRACKTKKLPSQPSAFGSVLSCLCGRLWLPVCWCLPQYSHNVIRHTHYRGRHGAHFILASSSPWTNRHHHRPLLPGLNIVSLCSLQGSYRCGPCKPGYIGDQMRMQWKETAEIQN